MTTLPVTVPGSSHPITQNQQDITDVNMNNDSKLPTPVNSMYSFRLFLLCMFVLQNSSAVLVGRYTQAVIPKDKQCSVNHLIIVSEIGKLVGSLLLEFYTTNGQLRHSLTTHVWERPGDALKISIPALLYLIQTTVMYVALSNLTAPMFQVTYQAKLVTTAIVSLFMLQRQYSIQQWFCLIVISVGVAIVILGEDGGNEAAVLAQEQNMFLGLVSVSIACFSSALAGVYFEKVLKKSSDDRPTASLWMRNMQLAFFSILIAIGQRYWLNISTLEMDTSPFFYGFSFWVWVLVVLQAGGGLLVAAVIKYADNVLKALAAGVSVVFATFVSVILFSTPLTGMFSTGAFMILISVYVFSNPIATSVSLLSTSKFKLLHTELKTILPK